MSLCLWRMLFAMVCRLAVSLFLVDVVCSGLLVGRVSVSSGCCLQWSVGWPCLCL